MKLLSCMNKKNVFIIFLIILFILIILFCFPSKNYNKETYNIYNKNLITDFNCNKTVTEEFNSNGNYNKVGFYLATYKKIFKKGKIILKITNERGKTKTMTYKLKNLGDNIYIYFNYKIKKGKQYKMEITTNTKETIALYTTKKIYNKNFLYLNGEKQKESLVLSFINVKKNYNLIWYYLMIVSVFCIIYIFKEEI